MKLFRILFVTIIFCLSLLLGGVWYLLHHDVVDMHHIKSFQRGNASVVLDDEGNELVKFELDKRSPVSIDVIPYMVIQAFVAVEDHAFFTHGGLSLRGILRSMLVNLYHRRVVQGASTITQQVARLLYLSHERTWWRKLKEVVIAFQLERRLTKGQILEIYLNNMYFGQGIYGVEAACQRFWGKSVTEATLEEAAMLAAIAKSAQFYSPLNAPVTALKRRNVVLKSMFKQSLIDEDTYSQAVATPLTIQNPAEGNPIRLYLYEWIRLWVERKWGRDMVYMGGLNIKTTINQKIQQSAEQSFGEMIPKLREAFGDDFNGGLVSLDVATGGVKAAIGGLDFKKSQFNRAFRAYRQLGSTFKLYLYALALSSGYDLDQIMVDEPVKIAENASWNPRNWTRRFDGPMTLARALVTSNNTISIKLCLALGIPRVLNNARSFGITRRLDPYPSCALGTAHGTPEENAAAFNVFANNGVYVAPYLIEWVKNESGKKIWEHEQVSQRVITKQVNAKMVKVLQHRMEVVRQQSAYKIPCEVIGKTGSTNGAATMWFVGSTPTLTTAIYLGRDDNKPLGRNAFASRTALPLWFNMYKNVTFPVTHFYTDPRLQERTINWWTGKESSLESEGTINILK